MASTETTPGTLRATAADTAKITGARVEASPSAKDRSPDYVDGVLHELHQAVARARCPVHDCGPALTVDFGSRDQGSLNVIARNCCPALDAVVARALRVYPLFRLTSSG